MSTLVMKFGGTSVGSTGAIKQCVKIIADARKNWPRTVVITSALSGITDLLLDAVSKAAAGDNEGIELITSQLHDRHLTEIDELVKDPSETIDRRFRDREIAGSIFKSLPGNHGAWRSISTRA